MGRVGQAFKKVQKWLERGGKGDWLSYYCDWG